MPRQVPCIFHAKVYSIFKKQKQTSLQFVVVYDLQMFGDRAFSAPLHRTANYLTNQRENSTYMYRFEFDLTEYETECEYWHGMLIHKI